MQTISNRLGRSSATRDLPRRLFDLIAGWHDRAQQRRLLADLARDPRLLRDLGISRGDVETESAKPFWRV